MDMNERIVKAVAVADPVDVKRGVCGLHPPVEYDPDAGILSVFSPADGVYIRITLSGDYYARLKAFATQKEMLKRFA